MAKDDYFEIDGVVTKAIGSSKFLVELSNGHSVTCTISGKIRQNFIRIMPGDKVTVEVSTYDVSKGRITWRDK